MRLSIRVLGLDLIDLELTTSEAVEDDTARDLSGGYLGSTAMDIGDCDRVMGFTNGRECE